MRSSITTPLMTSMLIALATVVLVDEPRISGLPIAFALQKPSNVSLAIYDKDGIQVRTLRNAEPLETGKHAIAWDGLDRTTIIVTANLGNASNHGTKDLPLLVIGVRFKHCQHIAFEPSTVPAF